MKNALLLFAAIAAPALGSAQVDPAKVIATVNGSEIRGEEYYRRMEYLPGVGKRMGDNFAEFPPGFLTLEQLITEKLLFQLAQQKGISVGDLEVTNEIASRSEGTPEFLAQWKASGRTDDELKERVRFELVQFKLQTFGITITDQEVDKYYADNPTLFTIPKRLKLRVIVVSDEASTTAADADLKAGKPFATVATERSVDLTKVKGGEYGTLPVTMLNRTFQAALGPLKTGQTTAWIVTEQQARVKFLVEEVLPEQRQPLTPALRRSTRRTLMLQRGRVKNDLEKEVRTLRVGAKIDIRQPGFAEIYKKFVEAYLKERGG